MKKYIFIAFISLLMVALYFVFKFLWGAAAMMPAEDIKIPETKSISSIEELVTPYLDHETTKALSIGVYDSGRVQFLNYGELSTDNPIKPTRTSIYEIGSITKTFTTAVLSQMVADGKVNYDDPISKYLPKEICNWEADVAITLEELATHYSGMPRLPDNGIKRSFFNISNPYKDYTEQDLEDFLKTYQPIAKDKRKGEYSNLGIGLLGNILAKVDNTTYEQLIQDYIVGPVGMSSTYAAFKKDKQVVGHNGFGNPSPAWEGNTLAGAGVVRSNIEDMMKYIEVNLANEAPYSDTHVARQDFGETREIGLGWIIVKPKNLEYDLLFHNGGTGGFRSAIMLSKEKQQATVVLSNSIQSVDKIALGIMELLDTNKAIAEVR